MAMTEFGPNHALTVKLWAKRLFIESLRETMMDRFTGTDNNSICQIRDELSKSAGDKITVGLRVQLNGAGVSGDNTLEGNEEALSLFDDAIIIDQLRHATRSKGKMSEQRVPFDVRQNNMDGLRDWWSDRFDTWFFNQLCGNTAQTDVRYTGMQATIAPDANHIYRPNSKANDESLTTGDELSLTIIDRIVARLKNQSGSTTVPFRPISIRGGKYFVMFIHPYQTFSLRTNTNAGQWADLQRAAVQAGMTDIPLFTGGSYVGLYNGVVIHEAARVTNGVNSSTAAAVTNARRAVICGAQAAAMATGRDNTGPEKMTWVEELFDYNNQLGVAAGVIGGMKKMRFNGADFGTFVISTYAPQP